LWEHTASSSTARLGVLAGGGVGVVRRSLGKSSSSSKNSSNSRRLVCAMRVSWDDLPISTTATTASSASSNTGTSTNADSTLVTVPCLHDVEHATIGLDVVFQSDYLYWLRQELQARRDCGHHGGETASSSSHKPGLPTNGSLLPSPLSLCGFVDAAVAASCSYHPLAECTSSMTNRIVSPQQQKQDAEEEALEDANSPWEWICSVC
jgi:hypothetical protein